MSEYTPGPWHVEAEEWTAGRGLLICAPAGPVAVIDPEEAPSAEDHANARLLAAAPEMAAALQLLISQYEAADNYTLGGKLTNKPFLMAKAALRTAGLLSATEVTTTL